MWQWLVADVRTLLDDLFRFAIMSLLVSLGPLVGATLGSIRRWYWARWQFGLFIGVWIGVQVLVIFVFAASRRPMSQSINLDIIMPSAGLIAAFLASVCGSIWFHRTQSIWVQAFRDHPWRWLRARSVRVMAVALVLLVPPLHACFRWRAVEAMKEHLRYEPTLLSIQRKWKPHRAAVAIQNYGEPPRLILQVFFRESLSDEALELLKEGPWPICQLELYGGGDVRNDDLIQAAPHLAGIDHISLLNVAFTDACLPALANCPDLQHLSISCPSITQPALLLLSQQRPELTIHLYTANSMRLTIKNGAVTR